MQIIVRLFYTYLFIIIIIILLLYNLFIHGKIYSSYKKDNKLILILILVYKIAVWGKIPHWFWMSIY
jgi:hypothetical protein